MIKINKKSVVAIFTNSKVVVEVRKGIKLIWQSIRSCFSRGYWINDQGWTDDIGWKN